MAPELRRTGISPVSDMPWGTHLCLFHETTQDLLAALADYFKAGLEGNEFCLWVLAAPLTEQEARSALRYAIPDLDRHLEERSIELLPHQAWYLPGGVFDLQRVVTGWQQKLDQAMTRGYSGMRVTGSTAWLHTRDWRDFHEYEEAVNLSIADKRLLALCTFSLGASGAAEVLDVAAAHQVAVALRNGTWEVIETPELTRATSELEQLSEALGQQVTAQTTQLATAKAELQMLSRRLVDVREGERRRFARELHDEMGGALTGLKLVLERRGRDPRALDQALAIVNELIGRIRWISFDIHPAELDELGLLAALLSHFNRYTAQTNIRVHFEHAGIKRRLSPEIETATYRIVQECLTNVARHARVRGVAVRVRVDGRILRLQVEDWGEGFDPEAVAPAGGLQGMRERAQLLGGSLRVESTPGRGARVTAELPLDW